ncbi:hypothetical protein TNIN_135771 [Trichonephila inaurata madagascariensis]|uniref:Uncharacterized protein n=1 Tax=Trichonephila inaurata madagascariensis TaxID=2747483 RepID=A0A8X7BY31_9ARAC|nr:hypothetical protein TNIN_135771 [Trichonephila inaurata madagascariensis]
MITLKWTAESKISRKAPLKEHKSRFNAPFVSEVDIMIAGELGDRRDIVLLSRSCHFKGFKTLTGHKIHFSTLSYLLEEKIAMI